MDNESGQIYAAKVEVSNKTGYYEHSRSEHTYYGNSEYEIYEKLKGVKYVPKVYGFHTLVHNESSHSTIIMDMLGPSLMDVFLK